MKFALTKKCCLNIHIYIYTHRHTHAYIYRYKELYTKTAAKEAVLLPVKSSSNDDPGFRHGFRAKASLPLTQGCPCSISQYYQTLLDGVSSVQMPYPLRCSYSLVLDLFYIFSLLCWCKSDFG